MQKKILAIETSCDETAAAVLSFNDAKKWPEIKTLSSVVKSQISIHSKFGGVVPEAAARAHVKNILPVVKKALIDSHIAVFDGRQNLQSLNLAGIDYIAVTARTRPDSFIDCRRGICQNVVAGNRQVHNPRQPHAGAFVFALRETSHSKLSKLSS